MQKIRTSSSGTRRSRCRLRGCGADHRSGHALDRERERRRAVPARQQQGRPDQARDLPAVRQHPLPARQRERPVRPGADAAPAATSSRATARCVTNDHTILISHTAGGILSSLTGLYPDRNGQTVSNSYDYFKSTGAPQFTSSFKYWTNTVDGTNDSLPNMVGDGGQTAPAPWLTYTAAGCNVGGVSAANIELENNSIAPGGDISTVFGATSPEAGESSDAASGRLRRHRSPLRQGERAVRLATRTRSRTTRPPSPAPTTATRRSSAPSTSTRRSTTASGCVKATDGTNITDSAGNCGFPGFDGALAKNTLGEVAQMQENGVPVTFAYISDAHDNHTLGQRVGPRRSRLPAAARELRPGVRDVLPAAAARRDRQVRTRSSSSPSTRATTSPAVRERPTRATRAHSSTPTPTA